MYIFIVNPNAGGGRGNRVYSKLVNSDLYKTIESKRYYTEYKGHAEEITLMLMKDHPDKITALIVIGGDGTLFEVINGLGNQRIPISFIPGGSGNDFARGCSIDKNPVKVLEEIIINSSELTYWVGEYQINDLPARLFTNSFGFGFDAKITRTANKSQHKKILNKIRLGKVSYIIAIIQELFRFKPVTLEIVVDQHRRVIDNCWMVTITNHPYYGGGMKIIPNAKIQSDVFPVLLIHSISKWKILALFMTVFTGKHINFKEVELLEATELTILSSNKINYQVDGETGTCLTAKITKRNQPIRVLGTNKT